MLFFFFSLVRCTSEMRPGRADEPTPCLPLTARSPSFLVQSTFPLTFHGPERHGFISPSCQDIDPSFFFLFRGPNPLPQFWSWRKFPFSFSFLFPETTLTLSKNCLLANADKSALPFLSVMWFSVFSRRVWIGLEAGFPPLIKTELNFLLSFCYQSVVI